MINKIKELLWMRKYNIKHKKKLRFCGVDCQYMTESDLVDKNSPLYLFIENKVTEYREFNAGDNYDFNPQQSNHRDKAMFDIFMKIYVPSVKYFLCAHDAHLLKSSEGASYTFWGTRLNRKFGKDQLEREAELTREKLKQKG